MQLCTSLFFSLSGNLTNQETPNLHNNNKKAQPKNNIFLIHTKSRQRECQRSCACKPLLEKSVYFSFIGKQGTKNLLRAVRAPGHQTSVTERLGPTILGQRDKNQGTTGGNGWATQGLHCAARSFGHNLPESTYRVKQSIYDAPATWQKLAVSSHALEHLNISLKDVLPFGRNTHYHVSRGFFFLCFRTPSGF